MPELPDLVRVERVLRERVVGRRVIAARTGDPTVLRLMVPEDFPRNLVGSVVTGVERRGHFMRFNFDEGLILVVNAMLAGRYKLLPAGASAREKDSVALGLAMAFDDGTELRYVDDKRMGKVYVARAADEHNIPGYEDLGVDILSNEFDRPRFIALCRSRRDQVRMFLMDKRALASIGNAYADEILFAARIHPKSFVRDLGDDARECLFAAIGQVLRGAIDEIQRRDQPIDVKVRDFLAVRGRNGRPCRICGTTIRAVRVGDGDACFCPRCQPATRRLFVDWGRLPASGISVRPPSRADGKAAPPPAADETEPPRRRSRRSANRRPRPSGS